MELAYDEGVAVGGLADRAQGLRPSTSGEPEERGDPFFIAGWRVARRATGRGRSLITTKVGSRVPFLYSSMSVANRSGGAQALRPRAVSHRPSIRHARRSRPTFQTSSCRESSASVPLAFHAPANKRDACSTLHLRGAGIPACPPKHLLRTAHKTYLSQIMKNRRTATSPPPKMPTNARVAGSGMAAILTSVGVK